MQRAGLSHIEFGSDSLSDPVLRRYGKSFTFEDIRTASEQAHGLVFKEYFAEDLKLLQTFIDDGLVRMNDDGLEVVSTGQLLIRNICMCFDAYLRSKARQQQFSRVI